MAETPKNPLVLDSFDKKHLQQIAALENKVAAIYAELCKEVGVVGKLFGGKVDLEKVFKLGDYPEINKKVDQIITTLHDRLGSAIVDGVTAQWQLANEKNDDLVRKVFGKDLDNLTEDQITRYFTSNQSALDAFLKRKDKGLGLSQKVWKYAKEAKVDIESTLELGIKTGQSAASMARDLKQYLKEPNKLFRRVRDKDGKLHLSKAAQAYHPGQGVYRSSYKNALRLAVTEANMAYRASDYERVQNFDFVVGIEVRLSNNHTLNGKPFYDICDELKGKYPKDFKFRGWHPFCYSKDSEVLTAQGWKKFADVTFEDSIISLNPETREVEYVGITAKQQYWYAGSMCRFYNKTLDCLVTPDHSMVYLNKRDGEIRYCQAKDYTKGKGGFYRSAMNSTQDRPHIRIGGSCYKFDAFCEFMGYWLSDGSLEHNSGVSISQNVGEKAREDIVACVKRLGFGPKLRNDKVLFYNARFNAYLKQFGYSYTKYVPEEIKTASARQIKIFLDAFIKCDGHERPCKSFVGSHGNMFTSQNGEKMYFTTSPRMAGDLCECMLKVGHRPSVAVSEPHTAVKKDGTIIQGNKPHYSIRECGSVTSTVFNKEEVAYSDYVYDLTLERNHIMYIKRNGKCFWGSNCRCHAITILKTREELMADNQRILDGQEPTEDSVNSVNDLPDNFKSWAVKNKSRILAADEKGTLPYFITDNPYSVNSAIGQPLASVKVPLWYAHNAQVKEVQGKLKEIKQWSYDHPKSKKIVGLINDTDAAISNGAAIEDILARFEAANKEYKGKLWEAEYVAKKKAEAAKKPTAFDIAKKRHEARTQQQIDQTKTEWTARRLNRLKDKIFDGLLPMESYDRITQLYVLLLKEHKFDEVNKGIATLQKAVVRHKARTPEKIKAIKDAWNLRKEAILKDEQFLSALIPNVKDWKKQFSSKKLHEVYGAVEKKMQQINALPLDKQVAALKKEIQYVSDATYLKPHTLYPTWEVSQTAYKAQLAIVENKLGISAIYDELEPINNWLKKHPKVKKLSGMVDEVEDLINSGADISAINAKMSAVNTEYKNKLYEEQYAAKLKARKMYSSADAQDRGVDRLYKGGDPYTEAEKAELFKRESDIIDKIFSGQRITSWDVKKYHDYALQLSEKYYKKQVSVYSADEIAELQRIIKKYTTRQSTNPGYIWGADLGGVYGKGSSKWYKVTDYMPELTGLTPAEVSVVKRFTNGSTFSNCYNLYKESPYWRQKFLGKVDGMKLSKIKEQFTLIEEYSQSANYVLDRMVRYNGITFRGLDSGGGPEVRASILRAFNSGKPWVNNASCSTSIKHSVAEKFDGDTILIIHNKTGAWIHPISDYSSEFEVMTKRGVKYRVIKAPIFTNGRWYAELEEII